MKKKILSSLFVGVLSLSLASCGAASSESSFDQGAYFEEVESFTEEANDLCVVLYNLGNWESSYIESLENIGGTLDSDSAASGAYEWLEEESDNTEASVEELYNDVTDAYNSISSPDSNSDVITSILENVETVHDDLDDLYEMVNSPSGDSETFTANLSTFVLEITDAIDSITNSMAE